MLFFTKGKCRNLRIDAKKEKEFFATHDLVELHDIIPASKHVTGHMDGTSDTSYSSELKCDIKLYIKAKSESGYEQKLIEDFHILVNGYDPVKDKKIDTVNHPYFKELCKTAGTYSFDARLERRYDTVSKEEPAKFVNLSTVNHYRAMDNIAYEEWKKEKMVCEKIGKEAPKEPERNVITITPEGLLNMDLDKIIAEAEMGTDITSLITPEEMKKNEERVRGEIKETIEEERRENIDTSTELKSKEDTKIYLRLKKEGYSAECIRELLRLSHESEEFTEDIITSYFTPDMDVEEMKSVIDLLI